MNSIWVGSLEIMLDEGLNHDWFASAEICTLGAVALVGFIAFLIWVLTEKNPIVDLKVFRHRGFVGAPCPSSRWSARYPLPQQCGRQPHSPDVIITMRRSPAGAAPAGSQ